MKENPSPARSDWQPVQTGKKRTPRITGVLNGTAAWRQPSMEAGKDRGTALGSGRESLRVSAIRAIFL